MFSIFSLVYFVILIVAITVHEFAHAYVADRLGDPTPRANDRLSLNPLKHLDPLGTIMLLFANIGWGKPVPIDPYNFRSPRRDEFLVSLAGPASNLILAALIALAIHFIPVSGLIPVIAYLVISLNVSLAVFNLLPVPPLDGSKIFLSLLPPQKSIEWQQAFSRYGYYLLAALLFLPISGSNIISLITGPIIKFILQLLIR